MDDKTFYAAQILLGNLKQIIVENQVFHPLMYNNTFYAGADFPRELRKMDLEDSFFPSVL